MSTLSDFHVPKLLWPALVQLLRVSCPADLRDLDLEARAAVEAELFLRSLTPGIRYGFLGALSALEVSARLRPSSRGKPFSRLDDDHARRHFESWWHAPSLGHAMAKAMKATVVMGFYELPEIRAQLAYAPDAWIAKVARRRMERYADEIRHHEDMLFKPSPIAISLSPDAHDSAKHYDSDSYATTGDPR